MKVSELFLVPEFKDFKLLAGNNYQDKEITSVNIIDSPDIYNFFRGGEFLLSAAFILKDDSSMFLNILDHAVKQGVVGLGVKLERYIIKIPPEVIDMANEFKFPIIYIPPDFKFIDIINPIYIDIINKQVEQLSFSEKVQKSFTKLVLKGGSIQQIIVNLSELLGCDVTYYDTYFHRIYYSKGEFSSEATELPNLPELLKNQKHEKIDLDKRIYGYLIFGESDQSSRFENSKEFQDIAIEHAATVIKLHIQKAVSNQQIESKYHDIFIQELLTHKFSTLDEIQTYASFYRKELQAGMVAVVFEWNMRPKLMEIVTQTEEITSRIKTRLNYCFKKLIYTKIGSQIIFLIPSPYKDLRRFLKELLELCTVIHNEIIQDFGEQFIIGIGKYKESLLELSQSYEEASQAIKVGREIDCAVCCYDDLGIYRLLAPLAESETALQFQKRYLDPLISHDQRFGSEYLLTVKTLIASNWNLKVASEKLFVHYNTMKNRYKKINELLDLDTVENKNNVSIALKLYLLSGK
ncbi:MAG: hypothetical protein GX933_07695 [Chloroflexi bacterium]|nr:hypothetical protein [Chloroflexota bacterium]